MVHGIFDCVENLNVRGEVVEDRDTSREASNRTERAELALVDLVLLLDDLEALPVHEIDE